MYFGSFLLGRGKNWPLWMAIRSTITATGAIIAAIVVKSTALQALTKQAAELGLADTAGSQWATRLQDWIIVLPIPGLILGLAAIFVKSARPVLAVLAGVTSFLAVIAIVSTLVAALIPMYHQLPTELELPE